MEEGGEDRRVADPREEGLGALEVGQRLVEADHHHGELAGEQVDLGEQGRVGEQGGGLLQGGEVGEGLAVAAGALAGLEEGELVAGLLDGGGAGRRR